MSKPKARIRKDSVVWTWDDGAQLVRRGAVWYGCTGRNHPWEIIDGTDAAELWLAELDQ